MGGQGHEGCLDRSIRETSVPNPKKRGAKLSERTINFGRGGAGFIEGHSKIYSVPMAPQVKKRVRESAFRKRAAPNPKEERPSLSWAVKYRRAKAKGGKGGKDAKEPIARVEHFVGHSIRMLRQPGGAPRRIKNVDVKRARGVHGVHGPSSGAEPSAGMKSC